MPNDCQLIVFSFLAYIMKFDHSHTNLSKIVIVTIQSGTVLFVKACNKSQHLKFQNCRNQKSNDHNFEVHHFVKIVPLSFTLMMKILLYM